MPLNLIDAAKSLFSNEVVNNASTSLGETENSISRAITGIVPAIFTGLVDKSSTHDGASTVAQMAHEQSQSDVLENVDSIFSANNAGLMNKASGIISSIFGNKSDAVNNLLSNYSGVKSTSVSSLLAMAAPLILSFLGRHAQANNLNSDGLANLLNSQKQNITEAMPVGLNLGGLLGHTPDISQYRPAHSHTATHREDFAKRTSAFSNLNWLLTLLLLVLLGAVALYFFNGGCNKNKNEIAAVTDSVKTMKTNPDTTATTPAVTNGASGSVDSMGNFIYNVGNMVTIDLPNAAGKLEVGENSTEAKLVRFLQSSEPVDTSKGNWFDFTNVRFKSGSSEITPESIGQLKNLVLIAKAFPKAKFKIGGYTDNTGDADKNVMLSKNRAAAVAAKVKTLGGAAGSFISSDGYGAQFPIGDNSTAEGRAQNRRVSVNVKAK